MKYIVLLTVTVLIFSVTGCNKPAKAPVIASAPKAEVVSVRVADASGQGVSLVVEVRVTNPNDVALPLKQCEYTLTIAEQKSRFTDIANRTLPARGTQIVLLPAAFPMAGASVQGQSYKVQGSIQYNPPGELRDIMTESGIPLPSSAFRSEGIIE